MLTPANTPKMDSTSNPSMRVKPSLRMTVENHTRSLRIPARSLILRARPQDVSMLLTMSRPRRLRDLQGFGRRPTQMTNCEHVSCGVPHDHSSFTHHGDDALESVHRSKHDAPRGARDSFDPREGNFRQA